MSRTVLRVAVAAVVVALVAVAAWQLRERLPRRPEPALVLISFDGFRWDYLERAETPNMDALAARGVRAEGLIPSYPSKTFPNHYTLVTGLRPGRHGIVSNNMYDPQLDAVFSLGDRASVEDTRWWGGEPLWVTAERRGVVSAALFWPGSEGEVAGTRATYWRRFDSGLDFESRVDQILAWLDLPASKRPRVIAVYFEEPDGTGHRFGPEAPETAAMVVRLDGLVGRLAAGLEARGLTAATDVVLVSDHGMTAMSWDRVVVLDDLLDLERCAVFEQGILLQLQPDPDYEDAALAAFDGVGGITVYRRAGIPARLHLAGHPRLAPLLGVPEPGWQVLTREALEEQRERGPAGGAHGFEPAARDMHGLFVAAGPSFRDGLVVDRFENVHVYELLTAAAGLQAAPNDGDPRAIRHLLEP